MNTRVFLIRMDDATAERLDLIARATERSKAAVVRFLVKREAEKIERQRESKPAQRKPFVEVRDAEAG